MTRALLLILACLLCFGCNAEPAPTIRPLVARTSINPTPTITPMPTATPTPESVCTATGDSNIRSGEGVDYPAIAWLLKGESLPLIDSGGLWWEVQLADGRSGFIYHLLCKEASK